MNHPNVWPADIYASAVAFLNTVADHAEAEDGAKRLDFEDLHPSTQIAVLDALATVARAAANASRAS